LFLSLFVGIAVREAGLKDFENLLSGPVLYGATFLLGLLLGVLCEANTILNPVVLKLLLLGILSLLLSGIGGLMGGYFLWALSGGRYNPVIGIAGVSCVPSTAKVAQKVVSSDSPRVVIMPQALGANICGVITTAILCGIYVTLIKLH
jgi:oxaloacetate decarboxylase beta subunit